MVNVCKCYHDHGIHTDPSWDIGAQQKLEEHIPTSGQWKRIDFLGPGWLMTGSRVLCPARMGVRLGGVLAWSTFHYGWSKLGKAKMVGVESSQWKPSVVLKVFYLDLSWHMCIHMASLVCPSVCCFAGKEIRQSGRTTSIKVYNPTQNMVSIYIHYPTIDNH